MSKPRLLDLFCGAGGCSMGYHRAGFEVVGVDSKPQPRYPFRFVQGDATNPPFDLRDFDAIHASPPCQAFTVLKHLSKKKHPDLIGRTRDMLQQSGKLYVIENVVGAPLCNPALICGSSFGLDIRRHRLFETNWFLMTMPCDHDWQKPRFPGNRSDRRKDGSERLARVVSVAGHDTRHFNHLARVVSVHGGTQGLGGVAEWRRAMGIDWMSRDELAQAIPPAYTEFIGRQLLAQLEGTNP